MFSKSVIFVVLLGGFALGGSYARGQSADPVSPGPVEPTGAVAKSSADSGAFAFGVKTSLFGVGAELAARATHRTNVRAGFNILGYSRNFNKDGVDYDAHLAFRTIEAHYDIFP